MKLPAMLLKAGLASAGAGIYLYAKKLFKSKKQTKKEPAKNLKTTKSVKNPAIKPRKKRTAAIKNYYQCSKHCCYIVFARFLYL